MEGNPSEKENGPALSVVIVTYNSQGDIYDCIDSVYRHADLPQERYEIIVVDNASSDQSEMFRHLSERYGGRIVLIANDKNGGYGQGNNIGIRRAGAPIVLIMNPDVRLSEPVFGAAIAAFERDARLTMYGMKQMLTPTQPARNSFACTYMMNGYASTLLTALCTRFDIYIRRYMHLSGACFFVRKSSFEAIGMFDESVFLYGEEDDVHYRLAQRYGNHIRYDRKRRYIHLVSGRRPNLSYEQTKVDVAVMQAEKKGYPARTMLRNRLQNTRLLLARERLKAMLGRRNDERWAMLVALERYIKDKMRNQR